MQLSNNVTHVSNFSLNQNEFKFIHLEIKFHSIFDYFCYSLVHAHILNQIKLHLDCM